MTWLTSGSATFNNTYSQARIFSTQVGSRGSLLGIDAGGLLSVLIIIMIAIHLGRGQRQQQKHNANDAASNFLRIDFTNTWGIIEGASYPYLRNSFSNNAPIAISGSTPGAANSAVNMVILPAASLTQQIPVQMVITIS